METIKLFICLCQQKDHHEQKQNDSHFSKEGFQCNDSPPWCNKSWNVHWRGSFPLSPIIRQTFSFLPQKLGILLFVTFEWVFLLTLCVSFWYWIWRKPNKKVFKPTTHAEQQFSCIFLICLLVSFSAGE